MHRGTVDGISRGGGIDVDGVKEVIAKTKGLRHVGKVGLVVGTAWLGLARRGEKALIGLRHGVTAPAVAQRHFNYYGAGREKKHVGELCTMHGNQNGSPADCAHLLARLKIRKAQDADRQAESLHG